MWVLTELKYLRNRPSNDVQNSVKNIRTIRRPKKGIDFRVIIN